MLARGQEAKTRDIEGRSNQIRQVLVGLDKILISFSVNTKASGVLRKGNGGEGYVCDTI